MRLLRRLVTAGWIEFSAGDRPVLRLTEAGRAVMKGERPPRVLLPRRDRLPTTTDSRGRRRRGTSGGHAVPDPSVPPTGAPAYTADTGEAELFEALRRHRLDLSRALGAPPYVVASDRTLRELATFRPRTLRELEGIYGIGPSKLERFGRGFLEVISRAIGQ
jgi:ATP-dependent DNA helicase RecQ